MQINGAKRQNGLTTGKLMESILMPDKGAHA